MPDGKPAGVPCIQLDDQLRCKLFGKPERPAVCSRLQPNADMCGDSREQALQTLSELELATQPTLSADKLSTIDVRKSET